MVVRGTHDLSQVVEEPDEVKVSRPVLKTNGSGDRFVEFNTLVALDRERGKIMRQLPPSVKDALAKISALNKN